MRKFFIIGLLLCFGLNSLWAQQTILIGGMVTDASTGEELPGVNILVKGTSNGTVTDISGKYTFSVPSNGTLVFSFVGMQTREIDINGQHIINVALEMDAQSIGEVVVTALGMKAERKALGYAVQDVKGDELTKASNTNMVSAMQGKIAGVDIKPSSGMPGASSQVVIRGTRSFTGNNNPLYVVDGMPIASNSDFESGFGGMLGYAGDGVTGSDISNRAIDIDPSEIESINILKGQAASALYGIRASNGVIVITTKSGKGLAKGKPVISANFSSSMERISRKPDLQNTWAQGSGGNYSPTSSFSWGPKVEDLPDDPNYGGNVSNSYSRAAQADGINTTGKYYVPQLAQAGLDPWAVPQKYDNIDDFFQTGYTINSSVNVSQSMEKANYSFGVGNTKQEGIISSTGMNRTSAKAAADVQLAKAWRTGFSTNFITNSIDKSSSANDALLGTVFPAPISYNLKGIPYSRPTDDYAQINYRSLTFNNPYWAMDHNLFNEKTNRFFGNGWVEFAPDINWSKDKKLSVRFQAGADTYTTNFQDIFEYGSRNDKGEIYNYGVTKSIYNTLGTINYEMDIIDDLHLVASVGNEFNQDNSKQYSERGTTFSFGGWPHINNAAVKTADEYQEKERTVGFFYSLTFSYKNMLYLNTTGRNDKVSSMPRNNRSFFYPSVSLGFIITELPGLRSNILSFAKLRASYAEVGQAGTYKQNYFRIPSYGGGFWGSDPIQYPIDGITSYTRSNTLYSPDLKPQNTRSYEFGFDVRLFDNMVNIDYNYSRQNVTDQIFQVPLAGSSGARYQYMNGGKIHTNSHEVMVSVTPIRTTDIDWNIGVNFSKIDNYVDELAEGVPNIRLGGFTTPEVRLSKGYQCPIIYGTSFAKDKQGRILVNEDESSPYYGMPMDGPPAVIGQAAPDFILGANTSFRYKRLTVSATFEWKNDWQMYSGTNGLGYTYGTSKVTEDRTTPFVYDGYKADGTPNNIPRGGENDQMAHQNLYSDILGNIDEAYIFDASFIKMRELVLNYKVPQIGPLNISVSVFARNLLIWTKLPTIDPESSQGNTNMGGAFERFSMPQTSSYGLSLNLVF